MIYATIALAWLGLFALAREHPTVPWFGALDADFRWTDWAAFCRTQASWQWWSATVAMWILMVGAMMLPSALPLLRTYADIARASAAPGTTNLGALTFGYLLVWFGFAGLAAFAQVALAERGYLSPHGIILGAEVCAALLVGAGLYQLSTFKGRLLSACQQPMAFFFAHWRAGRGGALSLGLRYGVICVGCCWALMLLAFVAGTMNLAWMGVATAIMILEKLRVTGRLGTHLSGAALIGAGVAALV